jgi:hypothetical protein
LPGLPGATRRPPVPDTRCKFRFPGLYTAPGETPGWCPFPAVKVFLRPPPASRKSPQQFISGFFPVHTLSTEFRRLSACRSGYPPPYAQLFHRSLDVTQRIPAMIAYRNHSVFSRRPSVNPEFPSPPVPIHPALASSASPSSASPSSASSAPGSVRPSAPVTLALPGPPGMTVDQNPRETGGNCPRSWPPPGGPPQQPRQPRGPGRPVSESAGRRVG